MSKEPNEHQKNLFRRKIREAIDKTSRTWEFDREDVAAVLEEEKTQTLFGDKENMDWLKGLGPKPET